MLEPPARAGDREAQYRLGSLYRSGLGTRADDALAFKWMKQSAEKGHANAQYNLASMYLAGRGTSSDLDTAREWLRRSAAAGYQPAERLLGDIANRAAATGPRQPEMRPASQPDRHSQAQPIVAAVPRATASLQSLMRHCAARSRRCACSLLRASTSTWQTTMAIARS